MNKPANVVTRYEGKWIRFVDKDGWEYVERIGISGVVCIAAVTPENKLVLVEQARPALGATTIELPAGLVGDEPGHENEHHQHGAERELLEETGYEAAEWSYLTEGPASSGLTSEVITFFMARGLRKVGKGGGVQNESIMVHEIPLAEIQTWLEVKAKAGFIIDPKVFTGLYFVGLSES
ncbi:MAG: NUDIX hydrolase [Candidatus Hydrogenedentes bacterium]|nr:NUDIX hydrolase [Candidatus Hydrogenedentota bacterium]